MPHIYDNRVVILIPLLLALITFRDFLMINSWPEFLANEVQENPHMTDQLTHKNDNPFWLCDLTTNNCIKLLGDKSADFLQGQATCDVNLVNKTHITLGSLCDYKGRVYAIFYLFVWQDNYYLWLPHDIIENTITQLSKYAVFSKVILQNQTNELVTIGIGGSQCEKYLTTILADVPKAANECTQNDQYILIKISEIPQRYLLTSTNSEMQKYWQLLRQHANHVSSKNWELNNITEAIPMIHTQTINLFTPHQLNLPELNAVSFNKGCYTGQEIVARTQYLGKLKQHLYRAMVNLPIHPQPGEKISVSTENNEINEIGIIVNSALHENNQYDLLAVLQDNAVELSPFILQQNMKYYLKNIER